MKRRTSFLVVGLALSVVSIATLGAQDRTRIAEPETHLYATTGGVGLKAYVFRPNPTRHAKPYSAIALFHGGGWHMGEPAWTFERARHFSALGMVAVAVQYRLSDQKTITPLEAMADARAAIRWMRSNATALGIDPARIAAYGWSAGAHLAASAAIFDHPTQPGEPNAAPNALVFVSPAVDLENDRWPQ